MDENRHEWNFENLVGLIWQAHDQLAAQAGRAVNVSLTLRNWLIGYYIAEYELRGSDRASYGDSLLAELSNRLTELKVRTVTAANSIATSAFIAFTLKLWVRCPHN